jgi:hypothetical protein
MRNVYNPCQRSMPPAAAVTVLLCAMDILSTEFEKLVALFEYRNRINSRHRVALQAATMQDRKSICQVVVRVEEDQSTRISNHTVHLADIIIPSI